MSSISAALPPQALDRDAGILRVDPEAFAQHFNRQNFTIEHGLAGHPLFTLPRLLELAEEVAQKWPDDLYYDAGVTDIGQRWSTAANPVPVEQTLRNIESAGAWVDLKSAERHPAYRKVLDACVADILQLSGPQLKKKMRRTQMAIFITSPGRISTYHIDSECNFLLQLSGSKQISIFSRYDREVLPEPEIERSWTVDTNAAVYKPQLQHKADVVALTPGKGVHIPVNAPHWVKNGNNISVSVAILYHSWNRDYANVYAANYYLRRLLGIEPTPPCRSPVVDALKQPLGAALIRLRNLRHGPLRRY